MFFLIEMFFVVPKVESILGKLIIDVSALHLLKKSMFVFFNCMYIDYIHMQGI